MQTEAEVFGAEHITSGVGRLTEYVLEKGEGSYVFTDQGKKLLDLTSGIGVVNVGHCHPTVTKAAQSQCGKITHAQVNITYSAAQITLLRALLDVMPFKELDTFFLTNSGSEAIESCVRIVRTVTKRPNVIVVQGSYHGRTAGAAAMTRSKTVYSMGGHPLMGGVFATAFPFYAQQGEPVDTPEEQLSQKALAQLRLLLEQQTAPCDTAAIFIETVLGEGGYVPAPASFLQGVRAICDEHGILYVADEIQSGYGRTGTMFAVERIGVRPDIMVMAKGLANGFPLSCVVGSKEIMKKLPAGTLGGTYAGNAVACAAATAVLDVFRDERVLENVAKRSEQLLAGLDAIRHTPAGQTIEQIRGHGLMIGIQFKPHDVSIGGMLAQACVEHGMLVLTTSIFDVIRLVPPLTITESEMDEALRILCAAFEAVGQRLGAARATSTM
ncbi:4-aminobutyrate--2-oxoglutarate transaminase [Malassezia vespertilionis]|uniref:4-aminobutyrate--2-oxoglutarate transaminase n=1 Tax=Malassezia vespertilionis TaxID=2020962 RepID=UPI0024B23E17|nr:4-aminobutyrate--2-oxoglutarate transaminase [Malassezia vespertilionis]WFD06399.1 4-aminobutyrate--2-oxoglutarate transaminase [Malassezia vespertilionis]